MTEEEEEEGMSEEGEFDEVVGEGVITSKIWRNDKRPVIASQPTILT